MLNQQINLYSHFEKPKTDAEFLTWKRYWISNILFAILMVIIFMFSITENSLLKKKLQLSNTELISFQSQFQKIKGSYPQFFFGEKIDDAVSNLKKEMAAQKKIIGILTSHNPFSQNLIALSQTIVPNVWLTEISIRKSGNDIMLIGESIGMKNMQDFITRLDKNTIYGPYSTSLKNVNNKDVKNPETRLSFELNMVKNSDG